MLALDGRTVNTQEEIAKVLTSKRPGETLQILILRKGRPLTFAPVLGVEP